MSDLPSPPWLLQGNMGFVGLGLVRADRLELPLGVSPMGLFGRFVPVLIAAASHQPGSTLVYSEFLIAPLIHTGNEWAFYPLILWVDDENARRGGKIWHLPKELAEFAWEERQEVGGIFRTTPRHSFELKMRQGGRTIFDGWWMPRGARFKVERALPIACLVESRLVVWRMEMKGHWRLASAFQETLPGREDWGLHLFLMLHLEDYILQLPGLPET